MSEKMLKLARELHPELTDAQIEEIVGDMEAFAQFILDVYLENHSEKIAVR